MTPPRRNAEGHGDSVGATVTSRTTCTRLSLAASNPVRGGPTA